MLNHLPLDFSVIQFVKILEGPPLVSRIVRYPNMVYRHLTGLVDVHFGEMKFRSSRSNWVVTKIRNGTERNGALGCAEGGYILP